MCCVCVSIIPIKPLDNAPCGRQTVNHNQPAWRVGHDDEDSSLHGCGQSSESNRPAPARLIGGQCCERAGYREAYCLPYGYQKYSRNN